MILMVQVGSRLLAFVGKELVETIRRPGAIVSLVLGPFLILALFGIGYRNQARALRTLFVLPPGSDNSPIGQQIQRMNADGIAQQLLLPRGALNERRRLTIDRR